MTVIARRFASIPARLASETWESIVDLIAPAGTPARDPLLRITGVASSLITREAMQDSPIVLAGEGPRVRIYCVYGEKAIEGTGVNEAALQGSPTDSDSWTLSLPCPEDDLSWVQESLEEASPQITARDMSDKSGSEPEEGTTSARQASINPDSLFRR